MKWFTYIAVFFWLLPGLAFAQKPNESISLTLDKNEILLGEQMRAELVLTQSVTSDFTFPILQDTLTGPVEIVEKGKIDTSYEGHKLETMILRQELVLTSFDTGYHAIPPIKVMKGDQELTTSPLLITVNDVEVDLPTPEPGKEEAELEIKDIKDVQDANFSLWEWIKANKYYLLGLLGILAFIWVYFTYFHEKLKKKGIPNLVQKKQIPPHEEALEKLKELDNQKLWQSGRIKEYHIELSEIIREYIEHQFGMPALESTTPEIMEDLKNSPIPPDLHSPLEEMLSLSDLVKFAKYNPLGDENDKCLKQAYHFVTSSKPSKMEENNSEEDV